MSNDNFDKNAKVFVGCLGMILSLTVTTPMWFGLLYALMSVNEMPAWSWGLYWCYVPAHIACTIVLSTIRAIVEAGTE